MTAVRLAPRPSISKRSNLKGTVRGSKGSPVTGDRGTGFTQTETDSLLGLLEELLPLCREEWYLVLLKHNERYLDNGRNVVYLKRKFASFHRQKKPTGDPLIPLDVPCAKCIRSKMTELADMGDGEDADSNVDEALPSSLNDAEPTNADVPSTVETVGESQVGSIGENGEADSEALGSAQPTPRPLVRKRNKKKPSRAAEEDGILSVLKLSFLQEQIQREQDRE